MDGDVAVRARMIRAKRLAALRFQASADALHELGVGDGSIAGRAADGVAESPLASRAV